MALVLDRGAIGPGGRLEGAARGASGRAAPGLVPVPPPGGQDGHGGDGLRLGDGLRVALLPSSVAIGPVMGGAAVRPSALVAVLGAPFDLEVTLPPTHSPTGQVEMSPGGDTTDTVEGPASQDRATAVRTADHSPQLAPRVRLARVETAGARRGQQRGRVRTPAVPKPRLATTAGRVGDVAPRSRLMSVQRGPGGKQAR